MSPNGSPPTRWRKAAASSANGGECIELGTQGRLPGVPTSVRDSKNTDGPTLTADVRALVDAVKADRFDG